MYSVKNNNPKPTKHQTFILFAITTKHRNKDSVVLRSKRVFSIIKFGFVNIVRKKYFNGEIRALN